MPRGIEQEVDVKTTGPSRSCVVAATSPPTAAEERLRLSSCRAKQRRSAAACQPTLRDECTQGCPALFMFYSRSWPYQSGLTSQRYGLTRSPLRTGHIRPPVNAEAGGQQSHGHASSEMEQHQRRRTGILLDSDAEHHSA